MVGGRFHQETKTGILDFEVRLGSASSLLELCPRRKNPANRKLLRPGKGNGKGGVFHMVCLFWLLLLLLLLLLFFFGGGLGEASVIFCPWLQEMFWDSVKL